MVMPVAPEFTVYLVRHGRVQLPEGERILLGQMDVALTSEGRQFAVDLATWARARGVCRVLCSDLQRSHDTAEVLTSQLELRAEPRKELREISLGEWEGLSFNEVQQRYPDEFRRRGEDIAAYRISGGESFNEVAARAASVLRELAGFAQGPVLIVGHAGLNRCLIATALGLPVGNLFRIAQPYGCLTVLGRSGGEWRLLRLEPEFERLLRRGEPG